MKNEDEEKKVEKKEKKPKEKIHSNRIRQILAEIGMSQQELADITLDGKSGHLSRIINGQRRCISLPIAMKIANALKLPVEEVFIYRPDEKKKNKA
jgi:DNA-binding XRE family transcriptional regulator